MLTSRYVKGDKVIIPFGITEIGACAFQYNSEITSVEIPDSVIKIGKEAFSCCKSLNTTFENDVLANLFLWQSLT